MHPKFQIINFPSSTLQQFGFAIWWNFSKKKIRWRKGIRFGVLQKQTGQPLFLLIGYCFSFVGLHVLALLLFIAGDYWLLLFPTCFYSLFLWPGLVFWYYRSMQKQISNFAKTTIASRASIDQKKTTIAMVGSFSFKWSQIVFYYSFFISSVFDML